MAFGIPLATAISGLAGIAGIGAQVLRGGRPKPLRAPPQATRNQAAERAAANDRLSRREGTNANRRTGYGGTEALTGPKKSLLGR